VIFDSVWKNELFAAKPSPLEAVPKLNCVELYREFAGPSAFGMS
jgi:hypothetical protein